MIPSLPGTTQQFLTSLQNTDNEMTEVTEQLSSGYRVNSVSDDPTAVPQIMAAQNELDQLNQSQTNLGNLQTELQSGEAALSQAVQNVESAISIASQSSASTNGVNVLSTLATQVQGILANLVNLSATTANGRYIFSGDQDQEPLYELDPTQPNGVQQLATATSTRVVTDASGAQVWLAKTATEIFDDQNPDGTPATDNVFAAVNSLLTALQNGDSAAAVAAIPDLQAADAHLNQELSYYGIGEANVQDTVNAQSQTLVTVQTTLANLKDVNEASDAEELSELQVQQQAALSAQSKIAGTNLFDFMG